MKQYATFTAVLQWDDQFGASSNDYNMYLYNIKTGSILAKSETVQNGYSDPIEIIIFKNTGSTIDVGIAVKKKSGYAKTLEFYGYNSPMYTNNRVSGDSIFGQAALIPVISVGAIDAKDAGYNDIQSYSSQGDVTIVYPQETRKKPDICGIDGVKVSGVGFSSPFYGTSAAAPHIAGIAALAWSASPSLSPTTIKTALFSSSADLGAYGQDKIFGWGRADAMALIQYLNINPFPPTPTPTTTPTVTPTTTQTPKPTIPPRPTRPTFPIPTIIKPTIPQPTKTATVTPTTTPYPTQTVKPTIPTKYPTVRPTMTKPTPRPVITFPWNAYL